MKTQSLLKRAASVFLAAVMIVGTTIKAPFSAAAEEAAKLPVPVITYSGMTLDPKDSVPTTDANLPSLIENTTNFNFNFYPDKAKMPTGESYFEYAYERNVDMTGLKLVGWWPTAQGVKAISIQYFDGESWKNGDQNISLAWTTPVTQGGPEELTVNFSSTITGTKFRIQILSMYQAWSTPRCCVRLLSPIGKLTPQETDAAREELSKAIAEAVDQKAELRSRVTDAADAVLAAAIAAAQEVYDNSGAAPAELSTQIDRMSAAKQAHADFAAKRTALQSGVVAAEELLLGSTIGPEYGQHPQSAKDSLNKVIASAKALLNDQTIADASVYATKQAALTKETGAFSSNTNDTLSIPEITVHNMKIYKGEPSYLVDRTNRDFNLDPGKTLTDAYLEYNYVNLVKIYAVDFGAWFPLGQGVTNVSFEYYQDGQWVQSDQNLDLQWSTPEIKDERITLTLSQPVETTKFRIRLNKANLKWTYICMHAMEPRGVVLTDIKALYEAAEEIVTKCDDLLVGSKPGEFTSGSVEAVRAAAKAAIEKLDKGEVNSSNFDAEMQKIREAWQTMLQNQVPAYDNPNAPQVTAEGLTVTEGSLQNLVDNQLVVGADFESIADGHDAYLVFDYGDRAFTLNQFTFTAENGVQTGFERVSLQYFEDGEWKTAVGNTDLSWRKNAALYEGKTLRPEAPVTASKFRLKILNAAETPNVREVMLDGAFAINTSALSEAVARAEEILSKGYQGIDDLLDILKMSLASAKNPDTLSRAVQAGLDSLTSSITKAADAVEQSQDTGVEEAKALLLSIIEQAKTYQLDRYVDGKAKDNFSAVLQEAQERYDDESAAKAEIDDVKIRLLNAMASLRLRADKTNLNQWIDEIKKIDLSQYTEESADVLRSALAQAESLAAMDLPANQSDRMIKAIAALADARDQLVRLEDTESQPEEEDSSLPGEENSVPTQDGESSDGNAPEFPEKASSLPEINAGAVTPESSEKSNEAPTSKKPATGDSLPIAAVSLFAIAGGGVLLLRKRSS